MARLKRRCAIGMIIKVGLNMQAIESGLNGFRRWMTMYFPIWSVRKAFLHGLGVSVGKNTRIGINVRLGKNTTIGSDCYIGNDSVFEGGTTIGDQVHIGGRCYVARNSIIENYVSIAPFFIATNDDQLNYLRQGEGQNFKGVLIRKKARIAANVLTLPGITVGEGSIVGASSVVTKDVQPYTLVFGNPAREHEDKKGLLKKLILEEGSNSRNDFRRFRHLNVNEASLLF